MESPQQSSPSQPSTWSNAALGQLFADTSVAQWIELPWICVMGETSSGKSTVLSQLSGIELPTDHTLTTKLPTLIQLRHDDDVCQVRIQLIPWNQKHKKKDADHHTVVLPQEQWHEIPIQIRRAQDMVTTQTNDNNSDDTTGTIRSDWWVTVSVQGPHVSHPFTLVDLPGLIQNSPEHPDLPQQVQALWKSIQHDRSILLAVHPSTSDFHNAAVWSSSSSSEYTIVPVLTKPDLIDPGAESAVVDLLTGRHPLSLKGFHLIKGRGQAALDQSMEQALYDEQRFFLEQEPWRSLTDSTCLGTVTLREKLSRMQLELWRTTLPHIVQEIRRKRVEASRVMEQFRPIQDRRRYFQEQSQNLLAKLQASIQGRSSNSAGACLHKACTDYADAIRQGSLYTVRSIVEGAHVLVTTPRGVVTGGVVHLDQQFCCVDFIHDIDSSSEALFERVGIPIHDSSKVEVDDVWSEGLKVYIAREGGVCDSLKKIPFHCVRTDPSWLKEKIAETRTDELACFLNVDIFKSVVVGFIEADWRPPCEQILQVTDDIARKAVSESIQNTLDERYPLLQSLLEKHCRGVVRSLMDHAREQVDMHLAAEKQPYTLDLLLLENIAESRHRSLRRELEIAFRLDQEGGVYDTQAIQAIMDDVFERQKHKTMEDHTAEDMEIILESYGKIATRRVLDRSPMICWEVLRSLIPAIQESFWSVSEEELIECTQDQEDTRTKYIAAREEFEEMEKALSIFEAL